MAGQQVMQIHSSAGHLAPWAGFAVFCAATTALLGLAYLMFHGEMLERLNEANRAAEQ